MDILLNLRLRAPRPAPTGTSHKIAFVLRLTTTYNHQKDQVLPFFYHPEDLRKKTDFPKKLQIAQIFPLEVCTTPIQCPLLAQNIV